LVVMGWLQLLARAGWIDPDTSPAHLQLSSLMDNQVYDLVFSDEFNVDNRRFVDGHDPKWTAMHKDDYTNDALQFYHQDLVRTQHGVLNITTIVHDTEFKVPTADSSGSSGSDNADPQADSPQRRGLTTASTGAATRTKNYQSAMLQGWNKFCFTSGIVEISAKLPGQYDIGGLWPAMWLLGNLARATYVGSSNNVWPWSYDTCNALKEKEKQQKQNERRRMGAAEERESFQRQQLISACNQVNHFDLQAFKGRGSPEIDILEAMAGKETLTNTKINRPYYSASLQVCVCFIYALMDRSMNN
jgi:beta-glucan synthesis-associated protein KRE6